MGQLIWFPIWKQILQTSRADSIYWQTASRFNKCLDRSALRVQPNGLFLMNHLIQFDKLLGMNNLLTNEREIHII